MGGKKKKKGRTVNHSQSFTEKKRGEETKTQKTQPNNGNSEKTHTEKEKMEKRPQSV